MKILILTNYANGLYLFRKELLHTFQEKGYETVVSVPYDENCKKLVKAGCRVLATQFERRGNNPIHDAQLFLRYHAILKEEKPDVVLTYTIKPNLYGGLACSMKKIPYIMNITGLGTALENPGLLGKLLLSFYKKAAGKAKCVFFQNEENKRFMQEKGIAMNQARLLPGSGVNLTEHPFVPYPEEAEGLAFLAVLRIMKDKGIEEYFEAARRIQQEYPFTRFYLAGEYEEETRKDYEPQIKKLEKEGVLHYYGHIDNVSQVMAKSHVIVHPSYHEGLSNVLLEAAACGRPVLASDVPGCRETLQPGLTGILFQAKSSESLILAIRNIIECGMEERRQMGIRGREYVENIFDRQKVIEAYLEEIKRVSL